MNIKSLREMVRILANIFFLFGKRIMGQPHITSSLNSTTLDIDDVIIAKKQLKNPKNWYRDDITLKYEKAFAKWNGSKYAFAFMGGRVALSAAVYALQLKPNDEIIIPGYTCVVVPNAFHFAGIKTIYSDIELDTYGLDASGIESKISPRTKAILIHHLYGIVCRDYEQLIEVAKRNNLYVIEDCAQSTGAVFKEKKIGNFGDVAIYSTEQSKVFTTIHGGFATTNNELLGKRIDFYKNEANYPSKATVDKLLHSVIINYYVYKSPQKWWRGELIRFLYKDKIIKSTTEEEEQGRKPINYGCKMPSALAEIGLNQLTKVDNYNTKRRQTAKKWDKWCDKNGYKKPQVIPYSTPVYLRYPVIVESAKKSDTKWGKSKYGVILGVWFISSTHPANITIEECPNAEKAVRQCINFPGILI